MLPQCREAFPSDNTEWGDYQPKCIFVLDSTLIYFGVVRSSCVGSITYKLMPIITKCVQLMKIMKLPYTISWIGIMHRPFIRKKSHLVLHEKWDTSLLVALVLFQDQAIKTTWVNNSYLVRRSFQLHSVMRLNNNQ